ncbi:GNAT family N-acetyltransferase [uncultured Limosilactobacillus sp.]|uniref:GNAT family N-acetyltransferase n=1 Tax=uncultured Limosilactobacillus sp. TaxID=2837629 RepID=UPI0025FF0017|nr:GNAT family N-acetyltransferase [uncultured Limosilactobacillus sp.]
MTLTAQTVSRHLTDYEQIKQLYHDAFPVDEQVKWSWLVHKANSKHGEFLAYYDHNQLVGFSYLIHHQQLDFLFFLAVDPKLHSQGYGGQILDWLNAKRPAIPLVLDAEPLNDDATNAEQRRRRLKFYQKHGFQDSHYQVTEDGLTYTILANQPFQLKDLEAAYRWFFRPFNYRHQLAFHQL